jgi:hypothetical protein
VSKLEQLTKAVHAVEFALSDMQTALRTCSAVESIIVLEILGELANQKTKLARLIDAIKENK